MTHRMKGGIVRRGKKWAAVICLGRTKDPVTGRTKQRQTWRTFDTYAEAEAYRVQARAAHQNGGFVAPSKMTLGEFMNQWLDTREQTLGKGTMANYRDTLRVHLRRAPTSAPSLILADYALAAITPEVLEKYLAAKRKDGTLAEGTLRKQLDFIAAGLKAAVRWGKLARNPAALVEEQPPLTTQKVQPPDSEWVRLFLAEAKRSAPRAYPLFLTAILTGCRLGELLALEWSDISFVTNTLTVSKTFYRVGKEQITKAPKTASGRRVLPLGPELLAVLETLKTQQAAERILVEEYTGSLVFCQPNGKPLHGHNVTQRTFRKVLDLRELRKDAAKRGVREEDLPKKLRRVKFHTLRHLNSSVMHAAGVPLRIHQERLGHADARISLDVYTHALSGQHEAAARAVEAAVLGKGPD